MWRKFLTTCAALNVRQVLVYGLILAVAIEAVTIGLRYGLKKESTKDTAVLAPFTFGLRVHHGYIGLFLVPLAWCFPPGIRHALWIVAIGLIVSDFVHHFFVLWPIEGSPQFDLVYPTKDTP